MGIRVVTAVTSPEQDSQSQSVDQSTFLEPHSQLVAELLSFDVVRPFYLVLKHPCMGLSDDTVNFSQIKHLPQ